MYARLAIDCNTLCFVHCVSIVCFTILSCINFLHHNGVIEVELLFGMGGTGHVQVYVYGYSCTLTTSPTPLCKNGAWP